MGSEGTCWHSSSSRTKTPRLIGAVSLFSEFAAKKLGWVSILDYGKVERLLGLPEGVQLIAYLCMGFPREFRARPMLEEVGWRSRVRLDGLIYQDSWGRPCEWLTTEPMAPDTNAQP